jgi:hypothetical protein
MIVPGTANSFRATASALRSLDGSKDVSFILSPGGSLCTSAG